MTKGPMMTSVINRENVLIIKPSALSMNLYQSKWGKKNQSDIQMFLTGHETAVVLSLFQVTDT